MMAHFPKLFTDDRGSASVPLLASEAEDNDNDVAAAASGPPNTEATFA